LRRDIKVCSEGNKLRTQQTATLIEREWRSDSRLELERLQRLWQLDGEGVSYERGSCGDKRMVD